MSEENYAVYVDAKILGRHDQNAQKNAYVAYVVRGRQLEGFDEVNVEETDDAECKAILFAISELKGESHHFTIFCDHQSVVYEARKSPHDTPSRNELINEIRRELADSNITLEWFEKNPAHSRLNKYLQERNKEQNTDNKSTDK